MAEGLLSAYLRTLREIDGPSSPNTSSSSNPSNSLESTQSLTCPNMLLPPPEEEYESLTLAEDAVRSWTASQGYATSRHKTKKNKAGQPYRHLLKCTRHGKLDNTRKLTEEMRVRKKRGSAKCGCPMKLWIVAADVGQPEGPWRVQHCENQASRIHNHGPAPAIAFPTHRRADRTEEIKGIIRAQQAAGSTVNQTMVILRDSHPELRIIPRDILNERERYRREKLDTMTPTQPAYVPPPTQPPYVPTPTQPAHAPRVWHGAHDWSGQLGMHDSGYMGLVLGPGVPDGNPIGRGARRF